MKHYISETCSLSFINSRDVECYFCHLFVKEKFYLWGAKFQYGKKLLSKAKYCWLTQSVVYVQLQVTYYILRWLNCYSQLDECDFLLVQYDNPIDTEHECPTHILIWINYGQEMRRRRKTSGTYAGQQGLRHHLLQYQSMEIYLQEALMLRSWRQGLWYQKQLVMQCNLPSIAAGLSNCIEQSRISNCSTSNRKLW